jgi:hypothetical protein
MIKNRGRMLERVPFPLVSLRPKKEEHDKVTHLHFTTPPVTIMASGVCSTTVLLPLIQNMFIVSVGKISFISVHQTDTIYII